MRNISSLGTMTLLLALCTSLVSRAADRFDDQQSAKPQDAHLEALSSDDDETSNQFTEVLFIPCAKVSTEATLVFDHEEEYMGKVTRERLTQVFREHAYYWSADNRIALATTRQYWSQKPTAIAGKHKLEVSTMGGAYAHLIETHNEGDQIDFSIVGENGLRTLTVHADKKRQTITFHEKHLYGEEEATPIASLTAVNKGFSRGGWKFKQQESYIVAPDAWPPFIAYLIKRIDPHFRSNESIQCEIFGYYH